MGSSSSNFVQNGVSQVWVLFNVHDSGRFFPLGNCNFLCILGRYYRSYTCRLAICPSRCDYCLGSCVALSGGHCAFVCLPCFLPFYTFLFARFNMALSTFVSGEIFLFSNFIFSFGRYEAYMVAATAAAPRKGAALVNS